MVIDVTSELRMGGDNELTYGVTVDGRAITSMAGYGNVVVTAYLVLSR